jgi:PII-like signaling protein
MHLGPMGFGKSSRMHNSKILRFSMDLPIATEIVESEQKIQAFLPISDEMIEGGLATMEKVQALHYRGIKKE